MPRVVVQPAFGGAAARQHWKDTLDSEVKFSAPPYSADLSAAQIAALADMHPSGQARFFGATKIHDRTIRQLSVGDVILFTGGTRPCCRRARRDPARRRHLRGPDVEP